MRRVHSYDDANRMTTTTLPNGVVGSSSYDNANRLTGVSWAKGGTTLASASYTLDNVGNRTARTDLAGIFSDASGHVNPETAGRASWIKTFQAVASDPDNGVSTTGYNGGVMAVFRYTYADGSQIWVNVWTAPGATRGIISDAGINAPGMAR